MGLDSGVPRANTQEETLEEINANTARITDKIPYNITLTNANTEYLQAIPAGTKAIQIQNRAFNALRWSFTTGKVATPTAPYNILKAGYVEFDNSLNLTSKTVYLASEVAGDVVEIICWT